MHRLHTDSNKSNENITIGWLEHQFALVHLQDHKESKEAYFLYKKKNKQTKNTTTFPPLHFGPSFGELAVLGGSQGIVSSSSSVSHNNN